MTDTPEDLTIAKLLSTLNARKADYAAARKEASLARNAETAALNTLNEAQQKFDTAIGEMRKSAPPESDWGRRKAGIGQSDA